MEFGIGTYALGLLAGVLSTLSPCVLPLLPILLGTAVGSHRYGPYALAFGLVCSYTAIGSVIAYTAVSMGFDPDIFRTLGAVVLIVIAVVLLSRGLQERFAAASSSVSGAANRWLSTVRVDGFRGQFVVGLALGLVWSPCVGPTLGAAITLASQGQHLPQIALLMAVFGLGAGVPLIVLGIFSRAWFAHSRAGLLRAGQTGKTVLGVLMLMIAVSILSGADKQLEAWIVTHSPAWLTTLTTRY